MASWPLYRRSGYHIKKWLVIGRAGTSSRRRRSVREPVGFHREHSAAGAIRRRKANSRGWVIPEPDLPAATELDAVTHLFWLPAGQPGITCSAGANS